MRTRLRSYRRREDELPQVARPPAPAESTAPPQNSLHALQRTIGNTALRRYLHPEQTGASSGLISRESAKEKAEENPALAVAQRTIVYMTMLDDKGKSIPGPSKRKGREGQFELLSFNADQQKLTGSGANGGSNRNRKTITEGDKTITSTKDRVGFLFSKRVDDSTALLRQLLAEGRGVTMHIEIVSPEADGKESAVITFDMDHVFLTNQTIVSDPSGSNSGDLETVMAEAEGMTMILTNAAEKAKQIEAKKAAVEESGRQ